MRWQTTAALAVILLALGGFYFLYEIRLAPEREKVQARKGRLVTTELADVTELKIERPSDTLHVKREGDGWQMVAPVRARADRGVVEDVLTNVVTAKSDREIAANPAPEALPEYGLDRPSARVKLVLKDGREVGMTLGGKSPTGTWVYARESDQAPIVTVGDSVLRDATRSAADFRDKTVLAFDRKEVTGFEVATRDDTIVVESVEGKWRMTRPARYLADADVVRELLDKLGAARVREFVAESPPSRAPWGLDRPLRVSVHTGTDKNRATRTLLLGRVDAEKKGVYAMREGETTVLLVPDELWSAVPRTVATARDKTVVDFERDKVARVELASPKGSVTLTKDGDKWRISAPESLPADAVEAGAVLLALKGLRAQAFLSDDASALPRFLATPEVRVTVVEEGAKEPTTVLLGSSPERRGGQPSAYAAVAGRGPVVLVDGKALGELTKSVTDLRDRVLLSDLAGLPPKEIKRVRVQRGAQVVLLERQGETDWRMLEPEKRRAKSARVEDLLYTLRVLRWKEIVEPAGKDAAEYGLAAPALEVSFYRGDGTEVASVQAGTPGTDRAYVRLKNRPAIYAVDPKQLGELPKVPDDFQG